MNCQPTPDETPEDSPEMVSASLVSLAQMGDLQAREQIFALLWPMSHRVARRMTASDDDARDVVQDAFVKALLNLNRFDHRASFRTWLMRIVTNTATDHLRSNRRKNRLFQLVNWSSDNNHANNEPGVDCDPSQSLHQKDLRREIDSALATLSNTTRGAFVLYAEAGMTYQEVAETLEIPLGTVMSRIHSARKKLQQVLGNMDNSDSSSNSGLTRERASKSSDFRQHVNELLLVFLCGISQIAFRVYS